MATDLDVCIRQCQAEREREKKHIGTITETIVVQPLSPNVSTPFTPPVADLAAIDIDAARTRKEFMRHMHGKCFGCRSTTHTKRDGSHKCNLCPYCKRIRHQKTVCMDRFLGRLRGQKAVATGEEEASDSEVLDMLLKHS